MTSKFVTQAGVSAADRNLFLLYRLRFDLTAPTPGTLNIFADTRYRLWVNGSILGYGPTRFYPSAPEYDTYDLSPYLQSGSNEIRVEVNSRNASSFQAVPSQPGFWTEGQAGPTDLGTPGEWQVKISCARLAEAPTFSFAQGPVEILDTALLEQEWETETGWELPIVASGWGEILPRSLPQPQFAVRGGSELLLKAPIRDDEERLIFQRSFPSDSEIFDKTRRFAVALDFYSPVEQTVSLGLFWGDNYLNGERLQLKQDTTRGNRQQAPAQFRTGWNLFYAEIDVVQPSWGFLIGWPRAAQLQTATGGLRVSMVLPRRELESLRGPLPCSPEELAGVPWLTPVDHNAHGHFPAREVAWDVPEIADELNGDTVHLWDFGREFLGHLRLHVESQQKTVLDVVADEVRRADGLLALYNSNPFVNSADRFIVPPGSSIVETFHPRGGRYVQVTTRSPGPVKITRVEERSTLLHLKREGHFECSDSLFNEIWRIGAATVEACLPDVWIDCPWREQGAYLGDTLVELHATRALSSNLEIGRRALRLWAQGQRPDGLLPACVPAWYTLPHADFSLLYILLLRDYWAYSGDVELVRELWPVVQNIFNSPLWEHEMNGLWTATPELRLFLDWGIPIDERLGLSNGALNALRVGALQAAAELAAAMGQDPTEWQHEAARVTNAFRATLWRQERNDFAPFAGELTAPGHHTNVLALCFGLVSTDQESGVLQNLGMARQLLDQPGELGARGGHLELYFIHFVLEALARRGLQDEAATWIRAAWSPMVNAETVTFWESLHRGLQGLGSLCHAWSCAPMWFFAREILGVHQVPGHPEVIEINPSPAGLQWARGTYPHASGPVEVAWYIENGSLKVNAHGPRGVTIKIVESY